MKAKDAKLIQTIGVIGCVTVIPLGFAGLSANGAIAIGVGSFLLYAVGRFAVWWNHP